MLTRLHEYLTYLMLLSSIICFLVLSKYNVNYGIFVETNYGFFSKISLPRLNAKKGWFLMEVPSILVGFFFLLTTERISSTQLILCSMYCVHFIHRSLIFPLFISSHSTRLPLIPFLFGVLFHTWNGFLQVYGNLITYHSSDYHSSFQFIFRFLIFVFGLVSNCICDYLLLFKKRDRKLPKKFLWRYSGSANYFCEAFFFLVCRVDGIRVSDKFTFWLCFCSLPLL